MKIAQNLHKQINLKKRKKRKEKKIDYNESQSKNTLVGGCWKGRRA
jgi:hypothetical protein